MGPWEIRERLKEALSFLRPKALIEKEGFVRAAVLVPLLWVDGELSLLLIKRSMDLSLHAGEIAFPGGRAEARDSSLLETALREACEEVGLDPRDVEVVGRLEDVSTRTKFLISPFVGFVPYPYPFKADGWEAERIIILPLREFADQSPQEIPYQGEKVLFYCIGPYRVWGATARIITDLLGILKAAKIL